MTPKSWSAALAVLLVVSSAQASAEVCLGKSMTLDAILEAIQGAQPFEPTWPTPDMSVLSEGRREPPTWPREVCGPWREWIEATAGGTGPTPTDYTACALLPVGAALIGNARWVSPWPSWKEPRWSVSARRFSARVR